MKKLFFTTIFAALTLAAAPLHAQTLHVKLDDKLALDNNDAWFDGTGNSGPSDTGIAVFGASLTGDVNDTFTWSLGTSQHWGGIRVDGPTGPAGNIVIATGNTLRLGQWGIDMANATTNLTINPAVILDATQAWNIAARGSWGQATILDR